MCKPMEVFGDEELASGEDKIILLVEPSFHVNFDEPQWGSGRNVLEVSGGNSCFHRRCRKHTYDVVVAWNAEYEEPIVGFCTPILTLLDELGRDQFFVLIGSENFVTPLLD